MGNVKESQPSRPDRTILLESCAWSWMGGLEAVGCATEERCKLQRGYDQVAGEASLLLRLRVPPGLF